MKMEKPPKFIGGFRWQHVNIMADVSRAGYLLKYVPLRNYHCQNRSLPAANHTKAHA